MPGSACVPFFDVLDADDRTFKSRDEIRDIFAAAGADVTGAKKVVASCGTGVTASGLITAKLHGYSSPISVRVLGGDDLGVAFETDSDDFKNVQLSGPADFVYTGQIEI